MLKFIGCAIVCAATLFLPSTANASLLYGTEFFGQGLYEIDTSDGSHITVGVPGAPRTNGIAYNSLTGTMYVIDGAAALYTIDLTDATKTLVGSFGTVPTLTGLTFSSDFSTLYAMNESGAKNLYKINPLTGSASHVGAFGGGLSGNDVVDFSTDSTGTVFTMGLDKNLYTVNTASGAATLIGNASGLPSSGVTSIAFDENDDLYGVTTIGDILVRIDTGTLAVTNIGGDIGNDVRGLAFALPSSAPIPEPSSLTLLGIGVVSLFGFVWRRKRKFSAI